MGEEQLAADARLNSVLDINHALHRSLCEKKRILAQERAAVDAYKVRFDGKAVEEPTRAQITDSLQEQVNSKSNARSRVQRDAAVLAKTKAKLEKTIQAVNEENLSMSRVYQEDHARLAISHTTLRTLQKRERELCRALDLISLQFNDIIAQADDKARPTGGTRLITDYQSLDGLCVKKLVGATPWRDSKAQKKEQQKELQEQEARTAQVISMNIAT